MNEEHKKRGIMHSKFFTAVAISALLLGSSNVMATQTAESSIYGVAEQLQTITVTGVVLDATGEPIIGASVVVKGTSNGTITDIDGNFTLTVPVKAILTVSYVGYETVYVPVLKPDSPQAIRELQNMGIRVVMITGDNARTARAIGAQAGVDEVIAGVLPDGKEREIRRLSARGKVAMVGDGINDAPALTRADIGIAIGAGTDVAIDAADVVLVNSHLSDVPAAIRLSRATLRNIHENLFWAFFYNTIGIPIAAGVFVPLGLTLNPMIGAAAMSLSSFCVVTNALRLNLFKLRDTRHDHKRANHLKEVPEIKEETAMKKTIQIEGMMCAHCEATVKKALEALPEVTEAEVSHTAGTAVVTLSAPVDDAVLKSTVEAKDYKVTGIA